MTIRRSNTPTPVATTIVVAGITYELIPPGDENPNGNSSLVVSKVPIREMDEFTFQVVTKTSGTLMLFQTHPLVRAVNREDIYPAIANIQAAVHAEAGRRERLAEANRVNRGLILNSLLFIRQQILQSGVPAIAFFDCFGAIPELVDLAPMTVPTEGKYVCVSGAGSTVIHMSDPEVPDSFRFDAMWVTVKSDQPGSDRVLQVLKAAHEEYQAYQDKLNLSQSPTTPSSK